LEVSVQLLWRGDLHARGLLVVKDSIEVEDLGHQVLNLLLPFEVPDPWTSELCDDKGSKEKSKYYGPNNLEN